MDLFKLKFKFCNRELCKANGRRANIDIALLSRCATRIGAIKYVQVENAIFRFSIYINMLSLYAFMYMRTTIDIENSVFRQLKQEAAKVGLSLKDYLNNILKLSLSKKRVKPFKLQWSTIRGKNPPAVPLEDRDRLFDFMDEKSPKDAF